MFIERLEFGDDAEYNALESSIHLGRYLLAKQYCRNMKVLDIACGEGYGSYAMAAKWGANEVVGVDISNDAIKKANDNFKLKTTSFFTLDAEENSDFFEESTFDLIVSYETIEHLANPKAYLANLKKWVKKDGIIIISCPNDNWYYRLDTESNPFHEKKYTFSEFSVLCEAELGKPRGYMYGMPVSGFSNISINSSLLDDRQNSMNHMFDYKVPSTILLPSMHSITESNVSYFIGIWGPNEIGIQNTSCIYGTSMDESRVVAYSDYLKISEELAQQSEKNKVWSSSINELSERNLFLERNFSQVEIENKKQTLIVKGLNIENEHLRKELSNNKDRLSTIEKKLEKIERENKKLALSVKGTNIENTHLRHNSLHLYSKFKYV